MDDVRLPGGGRATSRLGFGTSRIVGGPSARSSLALLEAAFEAGIRHFDTAPYYGLGSAETVLGTFLRRHPGEITVTTKFGLAPPGAARRSVLQIARAVVKPMVAHLPGIRARIARAAQGIRSAEVDFSPAEMTKSLEASLRALGCDRVDVFLLHEMNAGDMTSELRDALDDTVRRGLVGAWGVGSNRAKIDEFVTQFPSFRGVLQFEWSALSEVPPHYPRAFAITHQAVAGCLAKLKGALSERSRRLAWSNSVGADLGDDRVLARLLLQAALFANPGGIVLFSSSSTEHLGENARILGGGADGTVARFVELVAVNRQSIVA